MPEGGAMAPEDAPEGTVIVPIPAISETGAFFFAKVAVETFVGAAVQGFQNNPGVLLSVAVEQPALVLLM